MKELKTMGGSARPKELLDRVEPKLDLTAYEKGVYEKTGYVRWKTFIRYYAIDLTKTGLITRSKGTWSITDEGEKALALSPNDFMRMVRDGYKAWVKQRKKSVKDSENVEENDSDDVARQVNYQEAVETARTEISAHLSRKTPYEMQDLVEHLLVGMGCHVAFNAPKGRDGGIDLVAYRDPLGTLMPRIKIQVKHHKEKIGVKELRELQGLLGPEDVGLMVSTGGFSSEAERESRSMAKHIDLMDSEKLIDLWETNYDKISEEGKSLLPLLRVSFLAPNED
jgi:restriction system protein